MYIGFAFFHGASNIVENMTIGAIIGASFCALIWICVGFAFFTNFLYTRLFQNGYYNEKPIISYDDYVLKKGQQSVSGYFRKCRTCGKHPRIRAHHLKHVHNIITSEEHKLISKFSEEDQGMRPDDFNLTRYKLISKYFEICGCGNCIKFWVPGP